MDRTTNPPGENIRPYVPHRAGMCLLDRLLDCDEESVAAWLRVPAGGAFGLDGGDGVPAWVGIEYMAQAIAAWAGWQACRAGGEPKIGFLLGSRRYAAKVGHFPAGVELRIEARCEFLGDNGLGMFVCRILCDGDELAVANVSVFEPADPVAYLEEGVV